MQADMPVRTHLGGKRRGLGRSSIVRRGTLKDSVPRWRLPPMSSMWGAATGVPDLIGW